MKSFACALLALSLPVIATAGNRSLGDGDGSAKAQPETKAAEDGDADSSEPSESSVSALTDAGDAPAMELGLEIGEPTALTFTLALNPAGRLIVRSGFLHRSNAFQFGLEAPMLGAGYQHNLMQIPVPGWQTHLTVGAGALLWLRSGAQRLYPQLALSASVGLRMRSPGSPMTMQLDLSPQLDVLPYVTPAIVGSFGFSFALPGRSEASAPKAASDLFEAEAAEEPDPEPKPKANKRGKKKAKKVAPRRRSKKR